MVHGAKLAFPEAVQQNNRLAGDEPQLATGREAAEDRLAWRQRGGTGASGAGAGVATGAPFGGATCRYHDPDRTLQDSREMLERREEGWTLNGAEKRRRMLGIGECNWKEAAVLKAEGIAHTECSPNKPMP